MTEGGPRVSIIVQVLGNQGTARSTHRIWAAEGWSSALVWVSAWMAQTGVAVRLLVKRAPWTGLRKNYPRFFCQTADSSQKDSILTKDAGLRRPVQGALLQTHRCAASLIPYMGGGLYVGHSTGSDLEQDLTHATCRSRLIYHTLDSLSVTFFLHRHPPWRKR